MPILGTEPYIHADLGQQRAVAPVGYSIDGGYTNPNLYHLQLADLATVWSYTVPADTKTTVAAINVLANPHALQGVTNFDHARDGIVRRGAIVTLSVGGSPVMELEARMCGGLEADLFSTNARQYPSAADGAAQSKFEFGDGIQFTTGQSLTASAAVMDPGHTVPGIHPQVHHLLLTGRNTASGAPVTYRATCRPVLDGTVAFTWDGDASLVVGADGFTLLSAALRSDCGDNVVAWCNVLVLNDAPLMAVGHFVAAGGHSIEPQHIPLWGAELYPGDRLELRSMLGPDLGQVISVAMAAVEESMAGGAAPTIALVSPAEGAIAADDALVIDVTADDALALVTIFVALGDSPVLVPVYVAGVWQAGFTASSSAAITGGTRFTIRRSGGWPAGTVQTSAHAVAGGPLTSASWAWTAAGEAEPPELPLPVELAAELAEVDHVTAALARLPQQYRGDL